jgi:undecaprenyl-diphosphatase
MTVRQDTTSEAQRPLPAPSERPADHQLASGAGNVGSGTAWLVLAILSAVGFAVLALAVKLGVFTALDHSLLATVHQNIAQGTFLDLVSQSANIPLITVGLAFVVWLFVTKHHREAFIALALMAAITAGSELTKLFVGEARPSGNGDGIPGVPGAFPSGHELEVLSIWGMVTIRFWRSSFVRWLRQLMVVLVTIEVILVGVARLVLDEHWPADVLAGFLGGFVVLGLYAWFTRPGGWADRPPAGDRRAPTPARDTR